MRAYVGDTNVAVVANGHSPQAGLECLIACVDKLEQIRDAGVVLLDDGLRILDESMKHLSRSGQPGLGDAFAKWVFENQAVPGRCEQVAITPRAGTEDDFEEFPDDPDFSGFDRSDRKFAAVALASGRDPEVQNAVDSDWWDYRTALKRHGVHICFLCPRQFVGQ